MQKKKKILSMFMCMQKFPISNKVIFKKGVAPPGLFPVKSIFPIFYSDTSSQYIIAAAAAAARPVVVP